MKRIIHKRILHCSGWGGGSHKPSLDDYFERIECDALSMDASDDWDEVSCKKCLKERKVRKKK
jgi:hypothetical protein